MYTGMALWFAVWLWSGWDEIPDGCDFSMCVLANTLSQSVAVCSSTGLLREYCGGSTGPMSTVASKWLHDSL